MIFPPLPSVLHLRCDNGNLWRMKLFWKVFPGCLFSDETHLFLLLSLLRRTCEGKWSFHNFSPMCQRDKICSLKIELSQIVSWRSRACTDRSTQFDYWGQSPTSSLYIHNLPSQKIWLDLIWCWDLISEYVQINLKQLLPVFSWSEHCRINPCPLRRKRWELWPSTMMHWWQP